MFPLDIFSSSDGQMINNTVFRWYDIRDVHLGLDGYTGIQIARATTYDGRIYVQLFSPSGELRGAMMEFPNTKNRIIRQKIIYDLYQDGFPQNVIAQMLDVSQATVSATLNECGYHPSPRVW